MKKEEKSIFVCSECGYQSVRWLGKCPDCGGWNTFIEEISRIKKRKVPTSVSLPEKITDVKMEPVLRTQTGIKEFDRVLGGGIVSGSLILLAGEPGVGKSTLLLDIAGRLASLGKKVLYVSAEESKYQVKMRAERLNILSDNLYLLSATEMDVIKSGIENLKVDFVIVDSIQTVFDPELTSIPGSISQVRENTGFFLSLAKGSNCSVFLVGHITKEGMIAGPKVLEHMVDVVLNFEGEVKSNLRILRATKNRFGSTMEIGVFSMEENGLIEIPEASAIFLPDSQKTMPGAVIFPSQEGSRTILVEIQCLVTPTYYGVPKRSVTGLDYNRISMVTAVVEKKLKFNLGAYDVYFNTGGGLRVSEPAADLAVALSCVSSLKDKVPLEKCIVIGEIALTGEIRPVGQIVQRIKEAARLGYTRAIIPEGNMKDIKTPPIELFPVRWLKDAAETLLSL